MSEVLICVPGLPIAKGRAKASRKGGFIRMYTPKKTVDYENDCAHEARIAMQGRELLTGPLELKLQIFMPIPISYTKAKKEAARLGKLVPTKKPDSSNILKAVEDAFNEIVWGDDAQIVDHHVTKRFGEEPCVIAIITRIQDLQAC